MQISKLHPRAGKHESRITLHWSHHPLHWIHRGNFAKQSR